MTEPTSTAAAAQALAAGITAVFLSLTGVHPLAFVWGFIGAGVMLIFSRNKKRGELLAVLAGGFVGAAGGQYGAHMLGDTLPLMVLLSLIVGAGAKPLLSAAIARLEKHIGGQS